MLQEDPGIWLEWKEDAESIWAEVYGKHPETKVLYPGDTLIVFDRIFGMWCCREFKSEEFRNARSAKKWVAALFEMADRDPNTFRNYSKDLRQRLNGEEQFYI